VSREGREVATGQALSLPGHGQLCVAHISVNIIIITVLKDIAILVGREGGEGKWVSPPLFLGLLVELQLFAKKLKI
jgi:hypothetical protein